jgi:hypothetical protein
MKEHAQAISPLAVSVQTRRLSDSIWSLDVFPLFTGAQRGDSGRIVGKPETIHKRASRRSIAISQKPTSSPEQLGLPRKGRKLIDHGLKDPPFGAIGAVCGPQSHLTYQSRTTPTLN